MYMVMMFSFEILHARWAMLGALGALIPEILDLSGAFHFVEPVWWRVGYSKLQASIFFICSILPNYMLYIYFSHFVLYLKEKLKHHL